MNESTLTQLKIIVERTVRPVRASIGRKRKMREELLAHVVGAFEEERARLGDDRAALERTTQRFGSPAEVTSKLQEAVPAADWLARWWEGRPGAATLWILLRLAGVTSALCLVSFAVISLTAAWAAALPREAMAPFVYIFLAPPVYLFGLAFLTDWIEKGVYDPVAVSRRRVARSAACAVFFMLLFVAGATWADLPVGHPIVGAIP